MSGQSIPAAPPPPRPFPNGTPVQPGPIAVERRRLLAGTDPDRRAPATPKVLAAALATGLLTAWLLGDGLGVNLLLCAAVAAVAAGLTARSAGRRVRPWTLAWSVLALALLVVPALWDAGWPAFLSVSAALALTSLALHGGRRWTGVTLALPGVLWQLAPSVLWALDALRGREYPAKQKVLPVLKALAVAVVLLVVFGALFAGADAAMADVLESLTPSLDLDELPLRFVLLVLGLVTALSFAHMAAGPRRWDRLRTEPGRERGRLEWAVPLGALNLMFAAFTVVQVVVLAGGRDAIMTNTGMSRSEYARQGFWQLMVITVLTLVVVGLAKRWAPRSTPADRRLARAVLGTLCVLSLVVVGSALVRMYFYVDASGLTRLRLWVLVVEIWLGVVFLLVIAAGALRGAGWLPRAVLLSAALTAAVYGLMGPDAVVAEQNVARFERTGQIDLRNVRDLSVDAAPALDRLTGDRRTCALALIWYDTGGSKPWYAMSLAQSRARDVFRDHPIGDREDKACRRAGFEPGYSERY
ncbi:DUF4153 domain-containing protein [Kitasatospora sp. NPDC057223]|uniref:DUF4153 domain-containing protein n=1 Tax=Kitasatospora sp. NPDC057223 TaxID=3346055 RepID=UPI00363C6595